MSTMTTDLLLTPEDLLNLPDGVKYELVDGRLVERNMGLESSEIAGRIIVLLGLFLRGRGLGHLFLPDAGYQCFPHAPGKIRRPDVSFIRTGRLPGETTPKGFSTIAPDLAVEVISPNDVAEELEEKVADYLRAGVSLVWVVSPVTRSVRIHRPRSAASGPVGVLSEDESITGEEVLPGFSCVVREFFENA